MAWILALSPSGVEAHLGHVVTRAERYLKFDVEPAALRVVVSLTLGPSEMARIMRDADTNSDSTLDAAEAEAYMASWGEGLAEELTIKVDGQSVTPLRGEAYLDPQGPIRSESGSVEMVARIELDAGTHIIAVEDAMPTAALDRTDIVVRSQPGGVVHSCRHGDAPHECDSPIALPPMTASEAIELQVDVEGLKTWQIAAAAAAALLVLMLNAFLWRRRSRRE